MPRTTTGSTTYAYNDPGVDTFTGVWTDSAPYKQSTSLTAGLRLAFFGRDVTLTMGHGPDASLYDVYLDGTLYLSLNGYAASAADFTQAISFPSEGPHLLEIRNRTDKDGRSSGFALRFKSLATAVGSALYDLHTIQYAYDGLSRVKSAAYRPSINANGAILRQYAYAFDVAGNRTQANDNGIIANYTYDAANRLTSGGITYDAAGRMTSDGTNTYAWDRANRLLSMGGIQYSYNGSGQRVSQTVGGIVTKYLLDTQPGLWQTLSETTGTGVTRYVHGPTGITQQQNPGSCLQRSGALC